MSYVPIGVVHGSGEDSQHKGIESDKHDANTTGFPCMQTYISTMRLLRLSHPPTCYNGWQAEDLIDFLPGRAAGLRCRSNLHRSPGSNSGKKPWCSLAGGDVSQTREGRPQPRDDVVSPLTWCLLIPCPCDYSHHSCCRHHCHHPRLLLTTDRLSNQSIDQGINQSINQHMCLYLSLSMS